MDTDRFGRKKITKVQKLKRANFISSFCALAPFCGHKFVFHFRHPPSAFRISL